MADETIVIAVKDEVSDAPARKILAIATNAREAHTNLNNLSRELRAISVSSVRKLQQEMTAQTVETTRQAKALESLAAAQARTETAQARAARQQTLATTATSALAVQTQRLATEQERTASASDRAALAREKLAVVANRNTSAMDKEGDAAAKLFRQVQKLRDADRAQGAQQTFNNSLGVDPNAGRGAARASANVFAQDARDKAAAAKETDNLAQRVNALRSAIDPTYAAQARFNKEMAEAAALRRAGAISEQTYAQAVNMSAQAMNAATGASKRMTDQGKLNRFQLLTIQYTINDVIASLASGANPLTILAQQGGQVTQAWGGVGNTFRALGGFLLSPIALIGTLTAAVGASVLMVQYANAEFKGFQRTLDLTKGSAGLTAGSFVQMAEEIAKATNTSVASSRETAMTLAANGALQKQQIQELAIVTQNFAKLSGQSTEEVAKQYSKLTEDPAKFAFEQAKAYNNITATQYAYIKSLQDQGRETEAATAVSKVLFDYYGNQAPKSLWDMKFGIDSITRALSNMIVAFKDARRESSLQELVAASEGKINQLERAQNFSAGRGISGRDNGELGAAKALLATQKESLRITESAALRKAEATEKQRAGVIAEEALGKLVSSRVTNVQKGNDAVAAFRKNLADAALSNPNGDNYKMGIANQAALEKEIRERAGGGAGGRSDATKAATAAESRATSLKRVNAELAKEIDSYGMLGPAREAQRKFDEIDLQLKAKNITLSETEREAIQKTIAQIENSKASQQAMTAAYDAAEAPVRNLNSVYAATNALLAKKVITEQEANRQQLVASEAYRAAVDPLLATNRALDDELRLRGLVGRAREVETAMIQAQAAQRGARGSPQEQAGELESLRLRTEASLRQKTVDTELNSIYDSTAGKLELVAAKQIALNEAFDRGYIGVAAYGEAVRQLESETFNAKEKIGTDTFADRVSESFNRNVSSMEDTLTQFLMTGELNVKNFVKNWLAEMARMEIRRTITGPLSSGGGIGSFLGNLFSGGASNGGTGAALDTSGALRDGVRGMNGYAVGSPYIPNDQIARIHEGERIMTKKENQIYSSGGGGGGRGAVTITYNPVMNIDSRTDQAEVRRIAEQTTRAGNAKLLADMEIAGY